MLGEKLLHNHFKFGDPIISFDEIIDKIYNKEPRPSKETEMIFKGFFLADGASRLYK